MRLEDEHNLTGREIHVNLILRGSDASGRLTAFGFVLDLPAEELMAASGGKDIHVVAKVVLLSAVSATAKDTWNQSPEDILENGIPAFNSHRRI